MNVFHNIQTEDFLIFNFSKQNWDVENKVIRGDLLPGAFLPDLVECSPDVGHLLYWKVLRSVSVFNWNSVIVKYYSVLYL